VGTSFGLICNSMHTYASGCPIIFNCMCTMFFNEFGADPALHSLPRFHSDSIRTIQPITLLLRKVCDFMTEIFNL